LDLKVIPPIQLIICALLMVAFTYYFPILHFSLPIRLTLVLVLIFIASTIGVLALYDFYKHNTTYHPHTPEKTTTVVDSGIYSYSRNPMYLALVLVLISFALYLENSASFTVIPAFIWYITKYQIKPEERILTTLFNDDFQRYCTKVRRWL